MFKYLLITLLFISSIVAKAQDVPENDSLITAHKGTTLSIRYVVKPGENMQMLARRFYISEGVLAYANDMEAPKNVAPGTTINIPITKENFSVNKLPLDGFHELYYHVAPKDDMGLISTYAGVTKAEMRANNNMHGYTLTIGQTLFIGWIKMMEKDTSNPMSVLAYPVHKVINHADTAEIVPVPGGLDTVYNRQTNNGTSVLTEKGTAVFFEKTGKNNVYYAFHTTTPRGTVIKVSNPGTGKTIYVKVLDKLPDTKQYSGCIIGISNSAREALGVTGSNKAWVEITYPTN